MIPRVNNQPDTAVTINMSSKAEEIRQTSLHMIFELATELKEETRTKNYETVIHFRLLPVLDFIYSCCNILHSDDNEINAILKNLSLEPSSKMSEEAIKTNSLALNTPHSQIKQSRIQILETALHCCRQNKKYKAEYLLRTLFINIVRLDPSSSWEEILKSIELEQEHLETVIDLADVPGSHQEKYDCHLESYLDVLSKLVGFQFTCDETLQNKFTKTLERLEEFIAKEFKDHVSWQDRLLITKSLVFLYTRPEWLFYRERLRAKELLIKFNSKENPEACKPKIELDLILLQAHQAIENQYIQNYPREIYSTLLKNIIKLLPSCSPSETIMALSIGVKLYEALANDQADPNKVKTKILATLKQIIAIGDANLEKLDFRALRALAHSRFNYGFYLAHCFQTKKELELGCATLNFVSQDFWADIKTRQAAIEIKDIHLSAKNIVDCVKLDRQKFLLIQLYKLLLQQEFYELNDCFRYSMQANKQELKVVGLTSSNLEDFISQEPVSQKNFSLFFLENQFEKAENLLHTYLMFYHLKAKKMLENDYPKSFMRFYDFKADKNTDDKQFFNVTVSLDIEKIINFVSKLNDYPLAVNRFVEKENRLLNDYSQVDISMMIGDSKSNKIPLFKSSTEIFYNIYHTVLNTLKSRQGNLSYTKLTQYTVNAYSHSIWNSDLLKNILSLPSGSRRAKQASKKLRHDWNTLLSCCELAIDKYKFIDCYLPDDHDNFYIPLVENAFDAADIGAVVSKSKEHTLYWNEKYCEIAYNHYQHSLGKNLPSQEQALCFYLYGLARKLGVTDKLEEIQAFEELIDSCVPDTYEEIAEILVENQNVKNSSLVILCIAYIKSICMMKKQRVEEGMNLFIKLRDNYFVVEKVKEKKHTTVMNSMTHEPMICKMELMTSAWFDLQKVKTREEFNFYFDDSSHSSTTAEKDELQESSNCMLANPLVEKKNIVQQAREILKKIKLKKEKKQARVTSCTSVNSSSYASHSTGHVKVEEEVLPVISVKKYISKKCMQIFNCLWDENSSSNVNTAWELRSFKNNIKITREEALKLIQALGGIYTPSRGVGSHHVAHLPKIEFNGQDMGGLADYETGEFMITFTNDKELKHYQIIQLREILLTQGFNPDTVAVKNVKDND